MLDKPMVSKFAHVKPGDTEWRSGGLRDFFLYKDLGVAEATGGRVIAQLVKPMPLLSTAPGGTSMRRISTSS